MTVVSFRARRSALLAATAMLITPAAFAADTTIPNGTTRTTQLSMTGTDTLTIDAGGAIIPTSADPSVKLSGAATSDLIIDNSGTIQSTAGRAIRTSGSSNTFNLTLTNRAGGLIEGTDDAIGINRALAGGTVTINNYGTIRSTTDGQALDFNPALGGTVAINNYAKGVIEADGTKDIVRPGQNATITNYGTIQSLNDGAWTGSEFDRGDGIDFQSAGSGTVYNYGTIEAAKHGITGDTGATAFEIDNYSGGLILGRNGSGINFDIPDGATQEEIAALSTAHVVNYGVVAGAALDTSHPEGWDTDGDGVDIDYLATIENHGAILALGALGNKNGNPDDPNISDAISIGGGSVTNDGLIYSVQRGILVDDSEGGSAYAATSIVNSGLIYSGSGQAITLRGNFADSLQNSGVIVGDVDLGGGKDQFGNAGVVLGDVAGAIYGNNDGYISGNVAMDDGYLAEFYNAGVVGGSVDLGVNGGRLQTSGLIGGNVVSGGSQDQIINTGWIAGDVSLTGVDWGHNFVSNFGMIGGNLSTGAGSDLLVNNGAILGSVDLGAGDDAALLEVTPGRDGAAIAGGLDGGSGYDALSVSSSVSGTSVLPDAVNFETLGIRAGSWSLETDQSYSGGATVSSGASFRVNAALGATVAVEGGATLSGTGSVSGLVTTYAGAIISPGNSIGTLSVTGDASLTDAVFAVEMNADGTSDKLAVGGSATINGGTVVLDLAPGPYVVGTKATILTAAGGISGSGFSSLEAAPATLFIQPTLAMTSNEVTISLDRNGVPFATFAQTANQTAVANALDAATSASVLYNMIANYQTSDGLAASYDSLTGEIHADLAGTLLDQSMQTELTLLDRLRQIGLPGARPASAQPFAYGEEAKPNTVAFDALQSSGPRYSGWTQAFGSWVNRDGDGNAAATDSSVGGVLVGADLANENYTFGLAGGYSWGSSDAQSWSASADVQTGILAAYGGVAFDAVKLRGGASMGWSSIDTTRTTMVGSLVEHPQASYNATTGNLFGEVAYTATIGAAMVEPYAGLGWVSVNADDFSETNAPTTGLSSNGASYDTGYSTLGARFSTDIFMNGTRVTPRAMLGWRHAFSDVPPEAAMLFNDTGTGFTVAGTPIAQDSLLVEAGADIAFSERLSLGVTYSGSFADGADSNAVKLTGALHF